MRFFSKKTNDTPLKEDVTTTEAPAAASQTESTASAVWTRRDSRILGATQLQRAKDALRLAETKLSGQEESLKRLWAQMDWLRRSSLLSMLLEREKKHLFELNKQQAALARQTSLLERYESFEEIQGTFQRLSVLERQFADNKRNMSQIDGETDSKRRAGDEQEKKWQTAVAQVEAGARHLHELQDSIAEGFRLDGANESLRQSMTYISGLSDEIRQQHEALGQSCQQKAEELELLRDELERHRAGRQTMEMHEAMLTHGELILAQLGLLLEAHLRCDKLRKQRTEAIKRQEDENELLGRAYAQYQEIVSQIETLESELLLHRNYMQGLNSYQLQEQAMTLRSRGQMLSSALSLWKRITTGFQTIEAKARLLTELRLSIAHHEDMLRDLEATVSRDTRLCKEKEYTYLLSKGQDIIMLRADLKEGTACSVCGATHHPYHSDTILDQSKLIGEMKSDYEAFASEIQARQKQLDELRLQLASEQGQLGAEEVALNTIRIRQAEDVREWELFSRLDRSFADCNEQTNFEARLSMLRQLIENTARDAETAQKELDTFNFHQGQVTELSEKLQRLEQKKSELNVRLGELNTGCQVMAGSVERLQDQLDRANARFSRFYDELNKCITIKEWYPQWQQNPDALREHIKKMMAAWDSINQKIDEETAELRERETELTGMQTLHRFYATTLSSLSDLSEALQSRLSENDKQHENIVGRTDTRLLYVESYEQLQRTVEAEKAARAACETLRRETDRITGQHDLFLAISDRLDIAIQQEREKLDLWMHSFNLQHPPVQYAELAEAFADSTNWNTVRQQTKNIEREILLSQARVEDLGSRSLAMQTEDGCCRITAGTDMQAVIVAKQETLLAQRRETMLHIARLTAQLEDHEKALKAERNSAEVED